MIIEVDKEILLHSINIADSIISSKQVNTILSNCLFNVYKDEIEIVSTDNEIGIRTKLKAVSDSEGSFTLYGKKLAGLLRELPNGLIKIDVNEKFLVDVKTKGGEVNGHYTLIGMGSEEFPEIPAYQDEEVIEIEQSVLKELIRRVVFAASVDVIKPIFNGIYLISELPGQITAVASDSRRLSMTRINISNNFEIKNGVIIPLKTVNEIFQLLMSDGLCKFYIGENQCFFKIGNTEVVSRIIDGKFPNYSQVIPREYKIKSVLPREKFLETLNRVKTFTREPAHIIIIHLSKDNMRIEAKTTDIGECEENLNIKSNSNENISIGINVQFLIDAVREIDASSIIIGVTGDMSPVAVYPEETDDYISVVMPIKIKSENTD